MNLDVTQHLQSLVTEQRQLGGFRLGFENPIVEDEFRRDYAESNHTKTRPILVIGAGLILAFLVAYMIRSQLSWQTAAFTLGVLLPCLMATLVLSYKEGSHGAYELMLALTTLCAGVMCTSLTLRGSLLGAPYHFGAQVACIFCIWLVLGLRFWQAAAVAITTSLLYIWGMVHWSMATAEIAFCATTLILVNAAGGYCAYQLEKAVRSAFRESRTLNQLAERDGLTGLYNRRRYDENIEKIWRQSRRDQSQFSLLLIDIDHFKAFNDLYGHQAGDDALKQVAEVIASCAQRPLDFAARFGGEEFALLLYGPAHDYGRELPEHLRRAVEELRIPHTDSPTSPWLTVSIGVAIISPGTERSLAGAIQLADEALYQAKEEGRNRVVIRESRHAHIQTGRFRASKQQASA